jgi:putative ABC transport system permease protein
VAVVLAVVGIYGVAAFAVSRRTREIGIRMALGATRFGIVRSVMASGVRPVVIGLLTGSVLAAIGATALKQAFRTTPIGLSAADPVTYASVAALLVMTVFAAMFAPALRAARSDPSAALRQD